jgi:hypothetical protein
MSIITVAHDPSVRFADTSPASLGRKIYFGSRSTLLSARRSMSARS